MAPFFCVLHYITLLKTLLLLYTTIYIARYVSEDTVIKVHSYSIVHTIWLLTSNGLLKDATWTRTAWLNLNKQFTDLMSNCPWPWWGCIELILTYLITYYSLIPCYCSRTQLLRRRPGLHLPINATVTTLTFALALPVAIALFPQVSSVSIGGMQIHKSISPITSRYAQISWFDALAAGLAAKASLPTHQKWFIDSRV